jgi:pyruvyltransferase
MRLLKTWWMDGVNNYGDILTPYIFDKLGINYVKAEKYQANCIAIGSIAKFAKPRMTVLGSGFIRRADKAEPKADYKFVRGPLTRQKIIDAGGKCPEIYGDLACVLPKLILPNEKKVKIGILPHHVDYEAVKRIYRGEKIIKIDNADVEVTTKNITACEKIITSSLHGLIVAHAYGIPAAWVKFSDNLAGDGFKFYDYFASINQEAVRSTIRRPVYTLGKIDDTQILQIMKKYKK